MTFVYILVAVAALLFMITIHELGHYIAAKILKFRVKEFAIGFGKAIFKHTNKKTGEVFSIRLIPLGGYCAFEGEDDAGSGFSNAGNKNDTIAEDAGAPSAEIGSPAGGKARNATKNDRFELDKDGKPYIPFNKMAPWKRLIVLFCGAGANFLTAIVFSFILLTCIGYHQEVKMVVDHASPNYYNVTLDKGIKDGDILTGINGTKFSLLNNYQTQIAKYDDKMTFQIVREGVSKDVEVAKSDIYPLDGGAKYHGVGIIGGEISYVKMNVGAAIGQSFVFAGELAWLVLSFFGKMITGQVALSAMGGTFSTIAVLSETVSASMINLLIMIPLISANLAVFNLLPIPALDGARMVFVFIEWVRGKPVNPALENRIHTIGLMVLLGLVVLLDLNYLVFQRFF